MLYSVPSEDYEAFASQPKRWELLLVAQAVAIIAIVVSILRWRILVRALEIPFTLTEALRLGFLGYLLNFVSFGSVGGDVFKAVLAARNCPDKRPEAVASVLLDRAFGLLGLVILAWAGLAIGSDSDLSPTLIVVRNASATVALGSVVALMLAIFSGSWFERLIDLVAGMPLAGSTLARMARSIRSLRQSPNVLILMIVYSLGVHSLLATSVFLISKGLYPAHPTFSQHLMIVPPSMAVGTLPLAPGGVGYQEAALATLFKQLPSVPETYSAILVATIYRLVTLLIAGVGLIYYWASHGQELAEVARREASQLESAQDTAS